MSNPRFDINTMEKKLEKNGKELKDLATKHNCERIVFGLNAVDTDIDDLIETVSTAHRTIRHDTNELKELTEEKFNEISKSIPEIRSKFLADIDSNIETVLQPFQPFHKDIQDQAILITNSIRTNLTVSLDHLSELYSNYEKHNDYGIATPKSQCLIM